MAPQSQPAMPLQQRLKQLAQTLQFTWFVGHLSVVLSVISYYSSYLTFNFYSPKATFSYRSAFFSAAVTYGIVVYKAFRARIRSTGSFTLSPLTILSDENVQYLGIALVWLWSSQYSIAMLPFGIYSIFHIATYTRSILVPTFQAGSSNGTTSPPKSSTISDSIGVFVKKYYDTSMRIVASLEIALWCRIFISVISFTKGSWILMIIYTTFLRARYSQSSFVQDQFRNYEARIDSLVGAQSIPPTARQAWNAVRNGLRSFHDATSLNKFVGGVSSTTRKAA
ncbi:Nucleoporin POM33 [Golovinomyces cichoracearum]|uniref:Nucleoporin POM33 n=1 Tax=Golovinomyces cichoracearum TaxID=62708 RepID=A0A420HJG6_9PEZI|nr:Nucleoporin POM33 [Golovinomyces cichoracearum]